MNLVLFGPPGAGKSTLGQHLAQRLGREFVDGDAWIEAQWGRPVASYFDAGEEDLFRARELECCRELAARDCIVIAAGGGALAAPHARAALEASGAIFCLRSPADALLARLSANGQPRRPLLDGDAEARLRDLLSRRQALYDSFALQVDTHAQPLDTAASEIMRRFAALDHVRFELGPCSALMGRGLLARLPALLAEKSLRPPFAVVSDANVAPLHAQALAQQLSAPLLTMPAGEAQKTLETVRGLYDGCLAHGMERGGTIVAVGGGVVGDVAGFVAATLLRGLAWANLPTSLLAMADASLGGKVGVDLPQGKNLVGAFHPPQLVVADSAVLATLPPEELRSGMAEVIKAGVIGDAGLFAGLSDGSLGLEAALARAAAVKVGVVNSDPYERGERASLNLGHTIGHGLEAASGYNLRHGEAVAVGMVAACRLAGQAGKADASLADAVAACLERAGLPTRAPGLSPAAVRAAMQTDKKKSAGRLRFVLPRAVGAVAWGCEVEESALMDVLEWITHVE